jgi:hypothetical protein
MARELVVVRGRVFAGSQMSGVDEGRTHGQNMCSPSNLPKLRRGVSSAST